MKSYSTSIKLSVKVLFLFLLSVGILYAGDIEKQNENHYKWKDVKLADGYYYNLSEFTPKKAIKSAVLMEQIPSEYANHPETGLSTHPLYMDAYELVHMKTTYNSYFIRPDGNTLVAMGTVDPLNYLDYKSGFYKTIRNTISNQPDASGFYNADHQPVVKSVNPQTGVTKLKLPYGEYIYSQSVNMQFTGNNTLQNRKITEYKIGENGMFAKNVWNNIDMQVIFQTNGGIKTNYIIKERSAIQDANENVLFEEFISTPQNTRLIADENSGKYTNSTDWEGDLILVDNDNNELIRYNQPFIYDHSFLLEMGKGNQVVYNSELSMAEIKPLQTEAYLRAAYRMKKVSGGYLVSVVVNADWLKNSSRVFPIVIDPITVSSPVLNLATNNPGAGVACVWTVNPTNQTAFSSMTAAQQAARCHSTSLTIPAGYMLTGNNTQFSAQAGYVNTSCAMSNTFMQYFGPCGYDPRATNFFWYCNSIFSGTCSSPAGGVNPEASISRCDSTTDDYPCTNITRPSCSNQTITFMACIQTRCTGTNGTCNANARATGNLAFSVQIERITLTALASSSGINLCPGATTTLTGTGAYGAPNAVPAGTAINCTNSLGGTYTTAWTQVSGPATITLPAAGNTNNGGGATSGTITMPATNGTYVVDLTVCGACPGLGAALNCASRQISLVVGTAIPPVLSTDNAFVCPSTTFTPTITNVQAGYTYTWTQLPSTGLGTGNSKAITGLASGTKTVVVQATAPCTSVYDTIVVTYSAPPAPTATAAVSPICPNTSTQVLSNCTNCRIYTVASGGSTIATAVPYTTPSLPATTTYYVASGGAAGTCESTRTPVAVTVGGLSVSTSISGSGCTATGVGATFAGGTAVALSTATAGAISVSIPNNVSCADPIDVANCPVGNRAAATLTISGATNPATATTIQSVCATLSGCPRDITIWLTSPGGTTIVLDNQGGCNSTAYSGGTCWTLTGTATTGASTCPYSAASGYTPTAGGLGSQFVGENPNGTWTLYVNDGRTGGGGSCGGGTLTGFTITTQSTAAPTFAWTAVAPASTGNLSATNVASPGWTNPNTSTSYTYNVTVTDVAGCTGTGTVTINCPLAANMLEFTAQKQGRKALLNWVADEELANILYTIERSTNGKDFFIIGEKRGSSIPKRSQQYEYVDESPNAGTNYYRIKQTDADGRVVYTSIQTVTFDKKLFSISAQPNPTSSVINITIHSEKSETDAKLSITDMLGRVIYSYPINLDEGVNNNMINLSELSDGVYFVEFTAQNNKEFIKIVKEGK